MPASRDVSSPRWNVEQREGLVWKREREGGNFRCTPQTAPARFQASVKTTFQSRVENKSDTNQSIFFKKIPISNQILRLAAQSEKALFGGDDPAGCIYSDINPAEVLPAAA